MQTFIHKNCGKWSTPGVICCILTQDRNDAAPPSAWTGGGGIQRHVGTQAGMQASNLDLCLVQDRAGCILSGGM